MLIDKKQRHNELSKEWRKNNIDKAREQSRNWVKRQLENNPDEYKEKMRKRALKYYYQKHEIVRERDNKRKEEYRKNNKEEYNRKQREYRKNNPDKFKKYQEKRKETDGYKKCTRNGTLRKYGLDIDSYNNMVKNQEGKCAICKTEPKILVVDHCHKTSKVRNLLCDKCNLLLGMVESGIIRNNNILEEVAKYLKTHE